MINATELRIGNRLEQGIVNHIGYTEGYFRCGILENKYCSKMDFYKYDELTPIPLTEEILLKCGFKYIPCPICGQGQWAGMAIWSLITPSGNYITLRGNINHIKVIYPHGTAILYLHQLQNLYWCLVGEELEINL